MLVSRVLLMLLRVTPVPSDERRGGEAAGSLFRGGGGEGDGGAVKLLPCG